MIVWFIVPPLILGLGFYYLGRRLLLPAVGGSNSRPVWIGLVLWAILVVATFVVGRTSSPSTTILSWIGYVSLGFLSFLFFLTAVRDLVLGLYRGARMLGSVGSSSPAGPPDVDRSRRAHLLQLSSIGVVGIAAAASSYGFFEARRRPGIVQVDVPLANLPLALRGFRIVQISDVHAGLTVGREWIETVVSETMALKPDLIAFTGDLADGSVVNLRDVVAPFAELQAPFGKYFITGNHEYYSGAPEWIAHAGRLGYDVLMNEHRIVSVTGGAFVLAGVTDHSAGNFIASQRSDPARALLDAPADLPRILLAHQPKSLRQAHDVQYDLMLSGHTHGGQFFPWNLATAIDQPYLSGLHRPNGKWIYVSKGTGYWGPPVRLGARSEISVITLQKG